MATVILPKFQHNRFTIPHSFRSEEDFEHFVTTTLFPPELYTVINRSPGYLRKAKVTEANDMQPVLTLRDHSNGFEFNIQCRFRYALIANNFSFAKSSTHNALPVFLVLGLGGDAAKPSEVFLANVKDCPHVSLFKRHLKNKSISANKAVLSDRLWLHESLNQVAQKEIA